MGLGFPIQFTLLARKSGQQYWQGIKEDVLLKKEGEKNIHQVKWKKMNHTMKKN